MRQFPKFQQNKPLSDLSTFGIGGPALFFIEVSDVETLQKAVKAAFMQQIPYMILGKGSNCLFEDRGFNGLVILNKIRFAKEEGDVVYAGGGYSFSLLGAQTARKGLSGLEFASGIPATVGGAVYMNAGASGAEVADVVVSVDYVTAEGELLTLLRENLFFSYRTSCFQRKKGAIAAARFQLHPLAKARARQLEIISYRTATQPYGEKSAGCVFRNPSGQSAGALIEQCGLKGRQVGGAQVSFVHGNFIVNKNKATAQEVLALAQEVQSIVKEKIGVVLEMEIRVVPYDPLFSS